MDVDRLAEQLRLDDLTLLDVKLFKIADSTVTVATVVIFTVILLVTLLLSYLTQRAVERVFRARGVADQGTVSVARRLTHYAVLAVGLGIGLDTIGIDLAALFAAGAIFAIGIGFAMQNIVQNFVSGVILILERSIKPGDVLRIEGQLVKVSKMGIRATHARTLDDEELIVPNSSIVQTTVTNYTLRDSLYRLRSVVGVIYGSDMRQVRSVLEEAAGGVDWRTPEKEPVVFMREFGSSSVDFEVSVWVDDPWQAARRRSQLNEAIWWALQDAGITIAFPQVDVHFDGPVNEALTARLAG